MIDFGDFRLGYHVNIDDEEELWAWIKQDNFIIDKPENMLGKVCVSAIHELIPSSLLRNKYEIRNMAEMIKNMKFASENKMEQPFAKRFTVEQIIEQLNGIIKIIL